MLSNPKWILFYVLFFGTAMGIGHMLNGVWSTGHMSASSGFDLGQIRDLIAYRYDWIEGDWQYLRWVLLAVQTVGGLLIGFELVSFFLGRR